MVTHYLTAITMLHTAKAKEVKKLPPPDSTSNLLTFNNLTFRLHILFNFCQRANVSSAISHVYNSLLASGPIDDYNGKYLLQTRI